MKDLIIIGASGFGREVAWMVERINKIVPTWNLIGFLDDNDSLHGTVINGYSVIGAVENVVDYPDAYCVCAIGNSSVREEIVKKIKRINNNIKYGILIDPTVEISDYVTIGEGTIICAHTIITVNIQIGKHVIVNLDCTIGHDAIIQDYVTLYPSVNVSGITNVGYATELGTGMQIIQGKSIGEYCKIGAGSIVVKDIPPKCTAVGCPAKAIKFF